MQVAGVTYCSIDGSYVDATECGYTTSTRVREPIMALNGVLHYSATPKEGTIKITIVDTSNTNLSALLGKEAATIIVELANGKTVRGTAMTCNGEHDANAKEGTVALTFFGTVAVS